MILRTIIAFGLSWGLCVTPALAQYTGDCRTEDAVAGQIVDRERAYALDLSATALTTTVTVGHKVDVDDFEDRCINDVHIEMSAHGNLGSGCTIDLRFGAVGGQQLQLREAVFAADSHCPGWPDSLEGEYFWSQYFWSQYTVREPVLLRVEPFLVPDRESYKSCAYLEMSSHEFTLAEGRTKLVLEDLFISGTFLSQGSTAGVCPLAPQEVATKSFLDMQSPWQFSAGAGVAIFETREPLSDVTIWSNTPLSLPAPVLELDIQYGRSWFVGALYRPIFAWSRIFYLGYSQDAGMKFHGVAISAGYRKQVSARLSVRLSAEFGRNVFAETGGWWSPLNRESEGIYMFWAQRITGLVLQPTHWINETTGLYGRIGAFHSEGPRVYNGDLWDFRGPYAATGPYHLTLSLGGSYRY